MQKFDATLFYRPASEELRYLPECPRLLQNSGMDGEAPLLGWVAIVHRLNGEQGSINVLNCATLENKRIDVPGRPGFFAETTEPGVLAVGLDRRLALVNIHTGAVEETGLSISGDKRVIINDGMAIPGGLLFGTKHLEFNLPIAALYHFDAATQSVRETVGGQYCSNGKFYFTDGGGGVCLIDIDSIPRAITRYRFSGADLRTIVSQELVVSPQGLPSIPDGLRPCPNGDSIVVAYFNPELVADGAAQQLRLSDGAVLAEWKIPGSPRVTCPELFWWNSKVMALFSTATEGMSEEHRRLAPEAGSFFIAETPFDRVPAPPPLLDAASLRR